MAKKADAKPAAGAKRAPKLKAPEIQLTPQQQKNLRFLGASVGIGFLVFVIMGFTLTAYAPAANGFLLALLIGPTAGVAFARWRYGWPKWETKEGKPLVTERWKPYLFFPLAVLFGVIAYVVLGVFLTPVLHPDIVAIITLAAGALLGAGTAYFLVGFPPLIKEWKTQWNRIPERRRPWLFFPLAAVFTAALYFLIGLGLTVAPVPIPLQLAPLIALPLALLIAVALAYFVVGFPRPSKPVMSYVPDVPGRARPAAFTFTLLALGVPLAYVFGLVLTAVPGVPDVALVPFAFILGYATAFGASALMWGSPRKWRTDPQYRPVLPDAARPVLVVPVLMVATVAGGVAAAALSTDLVLGLVAGFAVGLPLGLAAGGVVKRGAPKSRATLLPELPDKVKPAVLFPLWLGTATFLFFAFTYALPDWEGVAVGVSAALGLAIAVFVVEQATLQAWRARRAAAKEATKERARKRRAALEAASGKPKA